MKNSAGLPSPSPALKPRSRSSLRPARRTASAASSIWRYLTPDIQKTYEELAAKGVEFVKPPTQQAWGSYALFKDSEGNICCLATESNLNPNKE